MNTYTLVIGANGATGKHVVEQLLLEGTTVIALVRNRENLPLNWKKEKKLQIIEAQISELSVEQFSKYIQRCNSIVSCLGHNLSLKGIYGKPRKLVKNAIHLICQAIELNQPDKPFKVVLMNTAGNRNKSLMEPQSFLEKTILGLTRLILPPQLDNECAADYLRTEIGRNHSQIEWVIVRPDSLINAINISAYQAFPSPIRSAILNPGKISRINVGHFMAKLIINNKLWNKWKSQMPVIYNQELVD